MPLFLSFLALRICLSALLSPSLLVTLSPIYWITFWPFLILVFANNPEP